MKAIRVALALALLVAALLPELARYRAERELRRLTSVAMVAASGRLPAPESGALLRNASRKLETLAHSMPGDSRPRMYAGSAALVMRERDRALALYLSAMECGERGEIDVNLGRAFDAMEDSRAEAMFLRAVWVSPGLVDSVPETYRDRLRHTIAQWSTPGAGVVPPGLPVLPSSNSSND